VGGAGFLVGKLERGHGGKVQHLEVGKHDDGDLAHDVSSRKLVEPGSQWSI
jgi:hypothetical protein